MKVSTREALGLLAAIQFVQSMRFFDVISELDTKVVVDAFKAPSIPNSELVLFRSVGILSLFLVATLVCSVL